MNNLRPIAAGLALCLVAWGLTGCSAKENETKEIKPPRPCVSTIAPAKAVPIPADSIKPVDNAQLPELTGGKEFGQKPEIAPGQGEPPKELQRRILIPGDGPEVTPQVDVTVNYLGQLWQGGVFDNSWDRGEPATFNLQEVVRGWTWGLTGTHVGDRVELVIPPELGYGAEGQGDRIPGNSTLVFIVDVLFAPPIASEGELAGMTQLLSKSTPTKEAGKLPKGLKILCKPGEEPQPVVVEGATVPGEPVEVWTLSGKGRVIEEGDMLGYIGVSAGWGDRPLSGWTDGSGIRYVSAETVGAVGKTVGSRIVLVGPPNSTAARGVVQVADIVSATALATH